MMIDADEWLEATRLTVFKNMYVEAGEPTDDAWHGDLGDLLLQYRGQACWSPYVTATPMRITADFTAGGGVKTCSCTVKRYSIS